ncbi:hypothetical protein BDV28DRAFT_134160 [Aspergillus coremiiformis]|uniref:Uncharacterized protein n=1 Tax=Aspergillus coremiiformis TaxID=138285 RepID=A0A5N6Z5I0_9EURO|nr:hypothetical protein BDV28DRAFT_134160 [Aspergillus coremiiformis]
MLGFKVWTKPFSFGVTHSLPCVYGCLVNLAGIPSHMRLLMNHLRAQQWLREGYSCASVEGQNKCMNSLCWTQKGLQWEIEVARAGCAL